MQHLEEGHRALTAERLGLYAFWMVEECPVRWHARAPLRILLFPRRPLLKGLFSPIERT